MSKKVSYRISGFDCPNCAAKTERHLNSKNEIEQCTIDFNNERLYLTFADKTWSIEEIKSAIKEVESDPIQIAKIDDKQKEHKIFDKKFFFMFGRILFTVSLAVFAKIYTTINDNFVLGLILYSIAGMICLYDILWKLILNIVKLRNPIDMNLLLSISTIGVIVLGTLIHYEILPEAPFEIDLFDGVLVAALYQVGELFEHIASNKSRKAIHSAIDLRVKVAHLLRGETVVDVEPEELAVGDKILVNVGDIIPVDGVVIAGKGFLDTSSLTGESNPVEVNLEQSVLSGCILESGSLTIRVEKAYSP